MSRHLHSGLLAGALLLSAGLAPQLAAQNLFVSSTNTKSVIEYDGETGAFEKKFARGGGLIEPEGLAFSPHDGHLLVASRSDEILRYDEKGTFKGVFASGNGLVDPAGIAFCGPDHDLFVGAGTLEGGTGGNQILRFDGATGAFVAVLTGDAGKLDDPEALVCGADGKLYVASTPETGNGEVLRYNPVTNAYIDTFIPKTASDIRDPTGMVFSPDGQFLFLSSAATSEVKKYNSATGVLIGTFIPHPSCGLQEAEGMVFLDGNLLVASELSHEVIAFNGTTGACIGAFVTAGSGNLNEPTFITLGPSDSDEENEAFRFRKVP